MLACRRFRLKGAFSYSSCSYTSCNAINSIPTHTPMPMAEMDPQNTNPSIWQRMKRQFIFYGVVLALMSTVAYALGWSLFHTEEVEMSALRDNGTCLKFTIASLVDEERIVEQPTLQVMSRGEENVARSRPMALKLDGTEDDKILLQPGDKLGLCAKFTSGAFKQDLGKQLQRFDSLGNTPCRLTVFVRRPDRSMTHTYSQVFNCASGLTSLYKPSEPL
jgi:hypothetical protein